MPRAPSAAVQAGRDAGPGMQKGRILLTSNEGISERRLWMASIAFKQLEVIFHFPSSCMISGKLGLPSRRLCLVEEPSPATICGLLWGATESQEQQGQLHGGCRLKAVGHDGKLSRGRGQQGGRTEVEAATGASALL